MNSEFRKNVLTLFSGTAIAQIIPFIFAPILSRIYTPSDYGLLALFVSISGLITSIATLQYESAIMLPKKDIDAINIFALSLLFAIITSFATLIVVVFFRNPISLVLGNEQLALWLYFLPITIFLRALFNSLSNWSSRKKQFKRLAIRTISQSGTTAGTKLLMGASRATNSGLIAGTIIGQFTATSVLAWLSWKEDKMLLKSVLKRHMKSNAKRYIDFPKYTVWHNFFDIFNTSGATFLISSFYGSAILGLYSFALAIIQKPMRLIGNAVTQVYFQKVSEIYNNGEDVWPLTKKIIFRLFYIGLVIFIPFAIAGPKLFEFIFGSKWFEAGIYARLITPWIFVRFVMSPISSIVKVIEKQKQYFFLALIYNLLFPALLLVSILLNVNFKSAIFSISILTSFYFIFILIWMYNSIKKN